MIKEIKEVEEVKKVEEKKKSDAAGESGGKLFYGDW